MRGERKMEEPGLRRRGAKQMQIAMDGGIANGGGGNGGGGGGGR